MRIDFTFNVQNRLLIACTLIKFYYLKGHKFIIFCNEESIHLFNQMLWTFDDISFIPHVFSEDSLAKKTPILLTKENPNKVIYSLSLDSKKNKFWLLNLSHECPPEYSGFSRLLEIVSINQNDRLKARERWKKYKSEDHELHAYKL